VSTVARYLRGQFHEAVLGWNRFWFTPADPITLALIRILAGAMLFYTHLVWSIGLEDFFGRHAWVSPAAIDALENPQSAQRVAPEDQQQAETPRPRSYAWSHFFWIESPAAIWTIHIAGLIVLLMLTLGLMTRVASVLAFLLVVSYANRVPGALFGLDDINGMLAMYLMVGPAGAVWSLDSWLKRRGAMGGLSALVPSNKDEPSSESGKGGQAAHATRAEAASGSVGANIAIRLMQVHLCIIYLFSGLGKLRGDTWWDGTAIWGAIANLEYQSIDMTWMAHWPLLINVLTHVTIVWEVFYCALIWPRALRPWMLLLAIPLHLGIAVFLGMMTFGLVMLIANVAFVPPEWLRALSEKHQQPSGAGQGRGESPRTASTASREHAKPRRRKR